MKPQTALELPGLLVDNHWLHSRLEDEGLIVLDARSEEDYRSGHIPGSVHFSAAVLFDIDRANKLPPVPEVEELVSAAGVDAGKTVVIYDQGDFRWAARMFWMFEVHGHTPVAVLDHGYDGWLAGGLPASTEPRQPSPTTFIANVAPEHLASMFQTRRSIDDPRTVIIDVRAPAEFTGEEDRWPRNGHIPTAVNIEWRRNLRQEDGVTTFDGADELRALYPFEPGTRFITYCTRGRRAAVSYLALRLAGFEAAVYDGSWSEWASQPELPVDPAAVPDRQQTDTLDATP